MKKIKLYRAVSPDEYAQLIATGQFEIVGSSVEGKYFAEKLEHAAQWGEKLFGKGKYRIIEVILPVERANQFYRIEMLDRIGPAQFAEIEQLKEIDTIIREAML